MKRAQETIPSQWERKACAPCTRAKRRCDKGSPACRRCMEKETVCQYPATRRYARATAPLLDAHAPCDIDSQQNSLLRQTPYILPQFGDHVEEEEMAELELSLVVPSPALRAFDGSWFLNTDTWAIQHMSTNCQTAPIHVSTLKRWIDGVWEWLRQWIREGCNPFIHKQLYFHTGLPQCLQDAWAALTAYFSKTSDNEDITMEIIHGRARGLLAQQTWDDDSIMAVPFMETAEHLARVQALFIYQFIRLFDGCIRQRALAEKDIPTMSTWCQQLWQSVNLDANGGVWNSWGNSFNGETTDDGDPTTKLWKLWILSESIRRTWLITNSMQTIFMILRDEYAACPGGLQCTARQGLWDAGSSSAWAEVVQRSDPIFVSCLQADQIFSANKASDIDCFSTLLLQSLWGVEKVENWASRS
ncbi:hypothetical protein EDB81DRAFT_649553 [Dactylonectria macrodidyma]|uniref:Zn(2)-C6 fungal-type domain-containing protein n=1 Tax=Dactylonectria macrodidyma TaxID=307937 RepID=A0A9P9EUR6_9HYPO|nr:hypothetical protein EDB81DRAFT_649553 [Dactylonectria macrodidyma]